MNAESIAGLIHGKKACFTFSQRTVHLNQPVFEKVNPEEIPEAQS